MSEVIKSCRNCKATSGFMCQQCYDMRCWEFDSVRNEKYLRERAEWKIELNEEIRADFAKWLEECGLLTLWQGDYCESLSAEKVLEMYKEQKNDK